MNNSFKIFSVIIGLLVLLVILRLNSITYPRDQEDNTAVVYLEEFHGSDNLFDIEYKSNKYLLHPHTLGITIKDQPIETICEVKDGDLLSIKGNKYQFNIVPRTVVYREVFRRTIRGLFPHSTDIRYIGGWRDTDRHSILTNSSNHSLLKKILVEISAELIRRLIEPGSDFHGDLLELSYIPGELKVKSPYLPFVLIRSMEEQSINTHSQVIIKDGDIIKMPFRDTVNPDEALYIKISLPRVKGVDYLAVSYKEKAFNFGKQKPGHENAFLKSLESGEVFSVEKGRKNAFIGDGGLFSFNLEPEQLLEKLFIPDKIPEGGVSDLKELLDRRLYYRKGNRYYPVTREFLRELAEAFGNVKEKKEIRDYFAAHHIDWRDFDSVKEFKEFRTDAGALIQKMENKGVFRVFSRETEKLNIGHGLAGVGLNIKASEIRQVTYTVPGRSWLEAGSIRENTPIVNGVDYFYWGNLIPDSDEPVEFKFIFNRPVPSIKLIAPANYTAGINGKPVNTKNYFDGVQSIKKSEGITELSLKIWNLDTFNRNLGSVNFQGEIRFKYPDKEQISIVTDGDWEGAIDDFHWSGVLVNPPNSHPHPEAGQLKSIWYDEEWNPVFNGVRSRYFRRTFRLESIPKAVEWKIFTPGNYLVRVNRKVVQTEAEFLDALRRGENRITIMVTKRGIRKHYYREMLFTAEGEQIVMKHSREQRARLRKTTNPRKPVVLDVQGEPLAYNCEINGEQQRFYAAQAMTELLSVFGSPAEGSWGLEQVFSRLYDQENIQGIRLTINRQWQHIALEAMGNILRSNQKDELENPDYQKFTVELTSVEAQLQKKRGELSATTTANQQKLMLEIIELQNRSDEIKAEINKIKNHFYEAAVVLMTPKGEIRTAASYPYNEETMEALNPHLAKPYRPGENPYVNRGWEWKYNPGSTAKILDSIAFLESKDRKDEKGKYMFPYLRRLLNSEATAGNLPRVDLKGSGMLNGKTIGFQLRNFQGHNIPAGFCSLTDAFAHSYNTYFSYLAMHNNRVMTVDSLIYNAAEESRNRWRFVSKGNIPVAKTYEEYPLLEFAEKLLLNHKVDLLYNVQETAFGAQLVRLPNDGFVAVESRFPVNAYSSSNIAHYSIGQGDFQLTALQNAIITSSIVNNGYLYYPSIISSVTYNGSKKPFVFNPETDKIKVYEETTAQQVKAAMKEVVEHGTAGGLFHDIREGRVFYAKTGTAETEVYRDNSLFVGFVEFREGEPLIFSVIVPRSGQGARVAGKLTGQILSAIITYENEKGKKF